jgi:hypothetical protein
LAGQIPKCASARNIYFTCSDDFSTNGRPPIPA